MKNSISLTQAVEGYELHFLSRRLSTHTWLDYSNTFRKFIAFLGTDPPISQITSNDAQAFLAAQAGVSKKTLLNYHTGLSALWTWALDQGLVSQHIIRRVDPPRPEKRAVQPYSEGEIRALLNSLNYSKTYSRPGKKLTSHRLINADRNRAIILLLLDTGLRATELCELRIHHVNIRNRHVIIFGKGSKERILPFCARTGQAIWKYLASRRDSEAGDYLFLTTPQSPFDRNTLRHLLLRIGERAMVPDVSVHRFRHTFAINFLRNGGNVYTLQMLLGHATLDMCKKYLNLAQADLESAHRLASPVANMGL